MASLDSLYVSDYMSRELLSFPQDMDVMLAIHLLVKSGHSGGPVVDGEGRLVGMLSEKDCLKVGVTASYTGDGTLGGPVREFMTAGVVIATPDQNLLHIATRFIDAPFKRLPVVQDGRLVGQISRSDVLRAINDLG